MLKRQVSTPWDRVRKFFEELEQQAELEGGFMAIVELCGFNDWLLQMLALATMVWHTVKNHEPYHIGGLPKQHLPKTA